MPNPEQQFEYATAELRSEARIWDDASAQLGTITSMVEGLELTRVEAGIFQLIVEPYNAVVAQVSDRCSEGAQAMTDIADTLVRISNNMDVTEATNEQLFSNIDPG